MGYQPFLASVTHTERISPHFQRIQFSGLHGMGPQKNSRDLRLKLIFPGESGLPQLPAQDWFHTWRSLPTTEQGAMRTYSVRHFDAERGVLTIDFVLHAEDHGPGSAWAAQAQPGAQILVVAPTADEQSEVGIEFQPQGATHIRMYGDETALPAIANILSSWSKDARAQVFVEVPVAADCQDVAAPAGVQVHWLPREGQPHGAMLLGALAQELGVSAPTPPRGDTQREIVWETPQYSAEGENLHVAAHTSSNAWHQHWYWWIAGESNVIKQMRRMLVQQAGVPRNQVSFMGYWKQGVSEN